MRNHLRVHTREKSNNCVVCRNDFSEKFQLQQHMVLYHGNTKEGKKLKIFFEVRCYFCQNPYPFLSRLGYHMKSHTKEAH